MRPGAPEEVLSGVASYGCVVNSWLGGRLLTPDPIPVASGRVTATVGQEVPERLTMRVPRFAGGRDWAPGTNVEHPLARFGQELSVSVVVGSSVSDAVYETLVGRFLVVDWQDPDDDVEITVYGAGLLQRVADDRLTRPMSPRPGGTLVSEARRLLPLGMSAGFDPALRNRTCPRSMEWPEDRLAALYEIADAWPARLRTDPWGVVQFLPPLPDVPTPVVTLTDGERGTVVRVPRSDSRENGFNRVVARSTEGKKLIQAVDEEAHGPMAARGPYGAVTKIFTSPLLSNVHEARAAAREIRRTSQLPTRTVPVTCTADPRLELDDPVAIVRGKGTRAQTLDWGWVVGIDLPLTHRDGDMRVDVGVSA